MGFSWRGRQLDYFDHHYNTTRLNERAVEVPVALAFLEGCHGEGLEVGNVLGHYGVTGHHVIDLYEKARGVQNIDVFDLRGPLLDWIVSISTVEHVRWDSEPIEAGGSVRAVQAMLGMLRPGGRMLVTAPLGHQPHLDLAIREGVMGPTEDGVLYLKDGEWVEGDRSVWRPYGEETKWASAVWVATWESASRR